MNDFGAKLRELRTQRGISQNQLAELLCVERATVGKWERGLNYPNQNILMMIADYFDVSLDFLFGRSTALAMFDDARTSVHPVLDMYNRLTPHQQELIIERMQGFIDGNQERQGVEREKKSQAVQYFSIPNRETKTE